MEIITSDGLRLVGDRYGRDGDPLVLLLHGGGQTRRAWGGAAEALAEAGFATATFDLRGHGESDWARDGNYGLDRFAQDVREMLAALGGSAFLVGASLGGLSCLLAAGEPPAVATGGLVLVDVSARMEQSGIAAIRAFMEGTVGGFATLDEAADAVARYMPHRPRPQDVSGLRHNLRHTDDGRLRWHWDPAILDARRVGADERLDRAAAQVAVPVLLLRGGASELVTAETAAHFAAQFPRGTTADIPGARHMVAGDRNDSFARAVTGFLQGLRPAAA